MVRSEPSLVPEWYRGASGSNLNHLRGFSHSERTSSSLNRSANNNVSIGREDLSLRAYGNFGRNYRDRNRDQEKDLELYDRNRPLLEDNGFLNNSDSLSTNKLEKESSRHSHSMVSGSGKSWLKSSFKRDFPSLGAEEKLVRFDVTRVASPCLSTAILKLPVAAATINGGDGWKSNLAEVLPIAGGNGPVASSSLPTCPELTMVSSPSSSLNMAETVAMAPARVHTSSQLPSDSQKIEELHRLQILKLRPVMPSIPKNVGLSSAEKSKAKMLRTTEVSASKAGQQSSSQLIVHAVRPAIRSDVYKIFQPGNFQVLNREKNSLSPDKDNTKPRNVSRVPTTPTIIPPASTQPLKGIMNPKGKVEGTGGALSPKKLPFQVQNRNDFFNSLRKKTSSGQHSNSTNLSNDGGSSFTTEAIASKLDFPAEKKNVLHSSMESENFSAGDSDDGFEEPEKSALDEEEEAFLRSLGWEENAGVQALTHEEIESFLSEYKMRRPASKLNV
ncbi:uncharacterized protein LOC110032144 [Phalaenopsis equestris]|uniref:uncharacterized protein LOC110032144 n=1 Tax=Phalaenopsis equestris TaxID=78828 RepID=UPI0009E20821|nr:uncharacterized protein LOC110032144 [Phalaenopsis equestris]